MILECEEKIKELKSKKDKLSIADECLTKEIETFQNQVSVAPLFSDTDEYKQINNIIEGLKSQIQLLEKSDDSNKEEIRSKIVDIEIKINDINVQISEYKASENKQQV